MAMKYVGRLLLTRADCRFFERISTTFKKDKWSPIVRQIRSLWYHCAQVTGNVEMAARLLVEMMCPASGVEGEDRAALQEDLALLLRVSRVRSGHVRADVRLPRRLPPSLSSLRWSTIRYVSRKT